MFKWNRAKIYSDVIEAILQNDEEKAKEILFHLLPDELQSLAQVAQILARLCREVWENYPEPDIGEE